MLASGRLAMERTLISGADIRRYRKLLGWNQRKFAERLGVTQAALSMIESGRIAISDDHIAKLDRAFENPKGGMTFIEFKHSLERHQATDIAATTAPAGRYLTLNVWRWQEGFDLGRVPAPDQTVDFVTIRATTKPVVAFAMPKSTPHWQKDEILVFEQSGTESIGDGDVCLVQLKTPRSGNVRTIIAVAKLIRAERGKAMQLHPISPAGPALAPEPEAIQTMFRAMFRARQL